MSIHTKLMSARLALQSKELKKSGHNKFAGYNYFELGDFLPTVQVIFGEVGLCGIVSFGTDLATLTITDMDDGSSIVITSPMSSAALKGCHEVQNLGAVQTYIRRYLWVTAMEIVEHDALDAITGSDRLKGKTVPPPSESGLSVGNADFQTCKETTQKFLIALADDARPLLGDIAEFLEFTGMKLEEKFGNNATDATLISAFYSLLDSKERAAIKKYQLQQREAA